MRQRLRTVTRATTTRPPVTRTTVPRTSSRQSQENTEQTFVVQPESLFLESVRSIQKDEADKNGDKDALIDNCLKEAIKHSREIEELENRTALHIEYAQEKQLEIQLLEETLETLRNESILESEKMLNLERKIKNLTTLLDAKDTTISELKDDISKLEETFQNEESKKHETIKDLNKKLEQTTFELANTKIILDSKIRENEVQEEELK